MPNLIAVVSVIAAASLLTSTQSRADNIDNVLAECHQRNPDRCVDPSLISVACHKFTQILRAMKYDFADEDVTDCALEPSTNRTIMSLSTDVPAFMKMIGDDGREFRVYVPTPATSTGECTVIIDEAPTTFKAPASSWNECFK